MSSVLTIYGYIIIIIEFPIRIDFDWHVSFKKLNFNVQAPNTYIVSQCEHFKYETQFKTTEKQRYSFPIDISFIFYTHSLII